MFYLHAVKAFKCERSALKRVQDDFFFLSFARWLLVPGALPIRCVWASLQGSGPTSVSSARRPSRSDALWSLTWGRSTASINSTPTVRDVPKSLCVRIVVTPQAALTSTSSTWDSVILEAPPFAGIIAARPTRTTDLHLQTVNSTHICSTQPLHTTFKTPSTALEALETISAISLLFTLSLSSSFSWLLHPCLICVYLHFFVTMPRMFHF